MIEYKLNHISFSIKGESHSEKIELNIKGLSKTSFNAEAIKKDLERRNPGFFFNTPRKEDDDFNVVRGIIDNKLSNDVLIEFYNKKFDKNPYLENDGFLRPSQSDYAQYLKCGEIKTGSGSFSGRMTLPLTFVGSIAKEELINGGVEVYSRIKRIGKLIDKELSLEEIKKLDTEFPIGIKSEAFEYLKEIKDSKDSIGGILEVYFINVKAGLGGELNKGLESKISNLIFSIPSVKGIEFGDGFDISKLLGSEVQDSFVLKNNNITTKENHNGGILGGVSTGNIIKVSVAFKPVPTIGMPLTSLNIKTLKEETKEFKGAHDVLALNRAIPAVEGLISLVLLDEMYEEN